MRGGEPERGKGGGREGTEGQRMGDGVFIMEKRWGGMEKRGVTGVVLGERQLRS